MKSAIEHFILLYDISHSLESYKPYAQSTSFAYILLYLGTLYSYDLKRFH